MKISVALCTYNGEQYIEEQLQSILYQTKPVDEVIICDDRSTDNTIHTINRIINEHPQFRYTIHMVINDTQLGVCENFQKAINLCTGDIIFLSDQDDIWYPNKVEIILQWFKNNPTKDTVFTNATLIDHNSEQHTLDTLFQRVGFGKTAQNYFNSHNEYLILKNGNIATGATMATKTKYNFGPFCNQQNGLYHDYIIALMAAQDGKLGYIKHPTMHYRLHQKQTCGIPNHNAYTHPSGYRSPLKSYRSCEKWEFPLSTQTEEFIQFLDWREQNILKPYGWIMVILHIFKYIKTYKSKWISLLKYDIRQSILHQKK